MPPNAQPRIEPAAETDLEAVTDLWVRLAREQRDHDSHVRPAENRATIRETLSAHRVGDGLLVARLDGEVVGFASFTVEHGTFELDVTRGLLSNLYVTPSRRGEGIGTALLEAVEDALAERGVDVVTLEAMADNEAARRFYRRNGYDAHRVAMERNLETKNDTPSKDER
ncbi:GNAT family N-acetyltransferase [Natrialbaceae archaeon AArc-T1-2]|uniref:GNAT family N-acetyltransferase n=1 Tax=Natrialbaceae archaeon AArc-T1-2 TaxID=3053904 RepID=UPI00255B1429|nr:GNAT family N-acetyltransferase [Natrialbaceae archaeon AArc-T1-2]WIV67280.1 GNAT family N-acetyltransferase [Natrialbaceae archaeon AArc-T1-2]